MHALLKTSSLVTVLLTSHANAHEGHGISGGSHWHATDTLGWVVIAVVIAVGLWAWRK